MQATQPWEDGPSRQEEERDGRLRPNEMPSRRPGCRRGKRGRGVLFLVLAAAVFLGVLFSPVFSVTEITVDGESHYSEEEIRTFAGASVGMNLFAFSSHQAEENLCQQSYIKDATVEKVFPDQVHITVTERRVRGYIPYMGAYLYIDDEGRVLEIKSSYTEPLPLIKGLSFDEFTLGQVIETDNPEALDVMVRISQAMTKYDLLDLVVENDLTDILITRNDLHYTVTTTTGGHIGGNEKMPPKKSGSRKYVCPNCGISVRATRVVRVGCLNCQEIMVER